MVVYHFEDSRAGNCVDRHLGGYSGILQVDGYGAYRHLEKPVLGENDGIVLAGCWAHVRRKFFELHANGESEVATLTVERMKALWAVDDGVHGATPEIRAAARRRASTPIVDDLFDLWDRHLPRLSQKSKLAEAIRYALTAGGHWSASSTTAASSSTATSSNAPSVLSASPGRMLCSPARTAGDETWATIARLLQTAKMNGVDPFAWLKLTLESGIRSSCIVPCRSEVVGAFGGWEELDELSNGGPEAVDGSFRGLPQKSFELGEGVLDRVEVR